jgi:hypothetical protein
MANDCQALYTCDTMLALPITRQMIDIQALNQRGTSKKPCCPKIVEVWKYIFFGKQVMSPTNLTTKIKQEMRKVKLAMTC